MYKFVSSKTLLFIDNKILNDHVNMYTTMIKKVKRFIALSEKRFIFSFTRARVISLNFRSSISQRDMCLCGILNFIRM